MDVVHKDVTEHCFIFYVTDSDGPEITFNDHPKKFRSNPTLTWSSSEPANFKCRMENSLEGFDCGNGMTGQFTGNKIPDGPHKLFVYGVDDMNNIGDVKELQFHIGQSCIFFLRSFAY